jgi:hypothetical protein
MAPSNLPPLYKPWSASKLWILPEQVVFLFEATPDGGERQAKVPILAGLVTAVGELRHLPSRTASVSLTYPSGNCVPVSIKVVSEVATVAYCQ